MVVVMSQDLLVVNGGAGGQVLRTTLGLSALLGIAVRVHSIRAQRPKPGLQKQHLATVNVLQQLCNAKVSGAFLHSNEVVFVPQKPVSSQVVANIGSAGSVGLVLQSVFFPSLLCENRLRVLGGTNVPFAPPFEFIAHVLLPELKSLGCRFEAVLNSHGFFPKGGGSVSFSSKRSHFPLRPVYWTELGSLEQIDVFSSCSSLPREVAEKQVRFASKELFSLGVDIVPQVVCREKAVSKGSSLVLVARFSSGRCLSATALGKKGVSSEAVGKEAAVALLEQVNREKAVDVHLADQLVPFLALAKGASTLEVSVVSPHLIENVAVCRQLLGTTIEISGAENQPGEVFVQGVGFKPLI